MFEVAPDLTERSIGRVLPLASYDAGNRLLARVRFASPIFCDSVRSALWSESIELEQNRISASRITCTGPESDLVELELLDPRERFLGPVVDRYLRIRI